jgi:hypothetical protein
VDEVYNGGMAGLMKCRLSFLPLKYSGLSISANPRRIYMHGKFLSMGGRICLIKAVLLSLPLYYQSLF